MSEDLKVLLVSSEAVPFAKTGGLADVVGALPKELNKLGCEVRVIIPCYSLIEKSNKLDAVPGIDDLRIPMGEEIQKGAVKKTLTPEGVEFYFLGSEKYYRRSHTPQGIYVDAQTGKDYPDSPDRFIFFSRGVLEFIKASGWKADVIHTNDWHSALVPFYLKTLCKEDPFFNGTAVLLTIHNISYQGIFEKDVLYKIGLSEGASHLSAPLEFYDRVNFMRAGIVCANLLNTVSPTYAREIQTKEFAYGLESDLLSRKDDLYGVVNGIDYSIWSPEVDKNIPFRYTSSNLSGKKKDKERLLKKAGLPVHEGDDVPLIGSISRLVDQKGFDILSEVMEEMLALDLQFILLGTGQPKYHEFYQEVGKRHPKKAATFLTFDEGLAHEIEAGADMFLMPSRYEPCGLNQLISLKYGTIPVVRATGGLTDTVIDFDPQNGNGNGFVFTDYSGNELLKTIRRALEAYQDKKTWSRLIANAMGADHSWRASAQEYVKLYRKAVEKDRR